MLSPKPFFTRSSRLVSIIGVATFAAFAAMVVLGIGVLGACSSSNTADTAAVEATASEAQETTADGSVVPTTPSVSIVEVSPDSGPPAGAPVSTAPPSTSPAAPVSAPQLNPNCKPLAEAFDSLKEVWSVIQLTTESKGAIGKSFEPAEIATIKKNMELVRAAVAKEAPAAAAFTTIQRGYAAVVEGDRFKDAKAKATFDQFAKSPPDFAQTQRAVGDGLRKQGCVVIG